MEIAIRHRAARRAVCIPHKGPYYTIGAAFGQFGAWLAETGAHTGHGLGIFYDNPGAKPADELRSDAGALVDDSFSTDDPRVHIAELPGGAFAVATHVGQYEGLPHAWGELVGSWLPASGYTPRKGASFEVYLNSCSDKAADALLTELYLPVHARGTA